MILSNQQVEEVLMNEGHRRREEASLKLRESLVRTYGKPDASVEKTHPNSWLKIDPGEKQKAAKRLHIHQSSGMANHLQTHL